MSVLFIQWCRYVRYGCGMHAMLGSKLDQFTRIFRLYMLLCSFKRSQAHPGTLVCHNTDLADQDAGNEEDCRLCWVSCVFPLDVLISRLGITSKA